MILLMQRWAHAAQCAHVPLIPRLLELIIRLVYSAAISSGAQIARNVRLFHGGLGVVINGRSVIEEDCEIHAHVVLGGREPTIGAPHLEQGVIVYAGAKLIGPIRIGQGAVIAANAVVLEDVPAYSLAAGVPATIRRRETLP